MRQAFNSPLICRNRWAVVLSHQEFPVWLPDLTTSRVLLYESFRFLLSPLSFFRYASAIMSLGFITKIWAILSITVAGHSSLKWKLFSDTWASRRLSPSACCVSGLWACRHARQWLSRCASILNGRQGHEGHNTPSITVSQDKRLMEAARLLPREVENDGYLYFKL